jgi:hypothetical protein
MRNAECETSNGNASETKANEGFDNSVFFASEAKRSEANMFARGKIIFEAKRTRSKEVK